MAFKLIGDGSITSSTAITTVNLTTVFPSLPNPYSQTDRAVVHETEAGYVHTYSLGRHRRRWPVSLRLMSQVDYIAMVGAFNILGETGWCFWSWFNATANGIDTVTISDSSTPASQIADYYNGTVAVILTTTDTPAAPEGELRRVTDYVVSAGTGLWTTAAFSATVDSGDTFAVGYPVRFVGGLSRQSLGNNLYNLDFTLEEVLRSDTDP